MVRDAKKSGVMLILNIVSVLDVYLTPGQFQIRESHNTDSLFFDSYYVAYFAEKTWRIMKPKRKERFQ
jgi:hypothetical protein